MIAPRNRLLFWFAVIGVPFSVLAGVHPASFGVCAVVITALLLVVAWDALRSPRRLEGLEAEAPPVSRLALKKEGQIALRLRNASRRARSLRLALPLPQEFATEWDELAITLPDETEWSGFSWICLPKKRGRFPVESIHVEASSPLGFWNARKMLLLKTEIRVYPNLRKERKGMN